MSNQIIRLSAAEYHADKTRISKHGLDLIHRAPALYDHERLSPPREQTPAMRMGELVHWAVLEPHLYRAEVGILPEGLDRRTKDGKAAYAELSAMHRHLVTTSEAADILGMAEAARAVAGPLLTGAVVEESIHWERAGVACRSRIDGRNGGVVFDLKTTTDATAFEREAFRYRYHVQAAFYLDALRACGETAERFAFVVVEKAAPYLSTVYWADDDVIDAGRTEYLRDLAVYRDCLETDYWPGLASEQHLTLPSWMEAAK